MLIRVWNANRMDWDLVPVDVPGRPLAGPRDDYILIEDSLVEPDVNGDFIDPRYTEQEIDAVHTFAAARLTVDLWEKALGKKLSWGWNGKDYSYPLHIELYNDRVQAIFFFEDHCIELGRYDPDAHWTCRSFDIVAHETTHAIIKSYRPDLQGSKSLETRAVIEAFCDLSPMFVLASIPQTIAQVWEQSQGDLSKPNLLSEFGAGCTSSGTSIRSALTIQSGQTNACDIGSPIVKSVYDKIQSIARSSASGFDRSLQSLASRSINAFANQEVLKVESFLRTS
ncbi:MAG: hypothetical protein OEQ53_06505 [Saprospiraceae bacterium]|nr:hypothetical protein [Saprospiraceae bacterium]